MECRLRALTPKVMKNSLIKLGLLLLSTALAAFPATHKIFIRHKPADSKPHYTFKVSYPPAPLIRPSTEAELYVLSIVDLRSASIVVTKTAPPSGMLTVLTVRSDGAIIGPDSRTLIDSTGHMQCSPEEFSLALHMALGVAAAALHNHSLSTPDIIRFITTQPQ